MDSGLLALLVTLGGAALTAPAYAIGKILSQQIQLQASKLGNSKWEAINDITKTAVLSAEQQISDNRAKKAYAMQLARKLLDAKKIKLDDTLLSPLIEAQIPQVTDSGSPVVAPPVVVAPPADTSIPPMGVG
jgi:hypothetical protein